MSGILQFVSRVWTYLGKGRQQNNELGDILEWQREEVTKLQKVLKAKEVLNKKQCINLLDKLDQVVFSVNEMIISTKVTSNKFGLALEELCRITRKARVLVEDCGKQEHWCHAAAFKMSNTESFRELMHDLQCFWDAICERYSTIYSDLQKYTFPCIDFNVATSDEIQSDEEDLEERLKKLLQTTPNDSEDYELAKHLLKRLQQTKHPELDALDVPMEVRKPVLLKPIALGPSSEVYKSSWLGLQSATKILKVLPNYCKEDGILACLSHPNLIKFICCGKFNESELMEISKKPYLVMELMETSLSDLLKKQKTPFPYLVVINIMHEIAKGMCYLHDMYVAHLDLKPSKVLLSFVTTAGVKRSIDYDFVKLIDYGNYNMEVQSKLGLQECTIHTTKYTAPEIKNNNKKHVACPFQGDVWSFAMTCSEILSLKEPFSGIADTKVLQKIKDCHRPQLPINCEDLTTLIEECWMEDPLQRPTFPNICKRLTILKKKFMVGTYANDIPQFDKDGTTSQNMQLKASNHMNIFAPKEVDERRTQYEVVVGLESNLANVRNHLKQVNILGLTGLGGIGKTTLVKAIFDDVKSTYNASCFVENLKSKSALEILCEILEKYGREKEITWKLVDAQNIVRELLATKKVLLILDDPKDATQVDDTILANVPCVNNGTKIIITTCASGVIKNCVDVNGMIDVGTLDGNAAKELFNSYAFLDGAQLSPQLFGVQDKIIEICNGLPLSLKVMGAFLRGKERIRSWEWTLQRMNKGKYLDGDERIWRTLRISFDGLGNDEKNMFLDIACLFPMGLRKERALHICTDYGTSPIHVLDILVDKSLVKIDEEGFIDMHDQLRAMGRKIVEIDKKYLGTRIWEKNMIPSANQLTHDKAYRKVEAIYLNEELSQYMVDNCKSNEGLDMSSLRLLIFRRFTTLPEGLGVLTSLSTLYLSECWSLIELPEGLGNLTSLTTLDLSECLSLIKLPKRLGTLASLTTLDLSKCSSLRVLPEGLGDLISLTTLDLSECSNLIELPEGLGNLSSLTTLDLSDCSNLRELPEGLGNMSSLTILDLHGCSRLTELPEGLGNLSSLTTLDLSECSNLRELPEGLGNMSSLTILDLFGCSRLIELPEGLGNLSSLTTLDLSGCSSLSELPEGLGNLNSLIILDLFESSRLRELPKGLAELTSLITLDLSGCSRLTSLSKGWENLTSLKTLILFECSSLEELPEGLGNLSSLTTLDLSKCSSLTKLLKGLGNLITLATLHLYECSRLGELPEGLGNLTTLTTLDLFGCSSLTELPKGFGNLTSLTTLDLSECLNLRELLEGLGSLVSLTTLDLSGCSSLIELPEGLGNLSSLTTLDMFECSRLRELPEGLGNLSSLTTLDLSGCSSLRELPEGLGNLSFLTTLDLSGCSSLRKLPKGLGNLTSLTSLDLSECSSLTMLPRRLRNLASLTTLDLSKCSISREVPERFENLIHLIPLADGLTSDKVDERRTQFEGVAGVESNLAKARNYLKQVNILVLILMGGIICRTILFSTITSFMIELMFFCLLNLFPYWDHRRQHKDLCIDKCGGYLFCERARLCMYMIYVQVCSLWMWTMVHRCHHLPNLHILIWSIVSLSLLCLFLGIVGLSKIEWKYRLWFMLKFVLQGKAYILSNYIREVVPDLAPCNPFANIVNSHDVDKFITLRREGLENLWLCEEQVLKEDIHKHIGKYGYLKRRVLYPIKTNQRRIFLIGSGWVEVDVLEEGNFRFKSSARGHTVQYFYATLSSQQFSTLLALLVMWEDSPNLGILENFVGRSDGIYCHCMDLQSIVETLFECTDFTVVILQKPMKFHIGAKCTREHCSTYLMATLFQVLALVGSYFQLKDNYNNVAIVLTFLGILVVVGAITSPSILLLEKILVYNVLRCFRLGSQRMLRLYLQLKIWKCVLAFCDDFKPVLHQANAEPELITLFNCTHGSFTGDFDRPDWSEVEANQTPYVANVNAKTNVLTGKSGETLEYRQGSVRIFDLKCRRIVFAQSTYDGDVLRTQLQLDGENFEEYNWSEDCYFLFIYLMIKWSRRQFGVIRSSRHLMYRRYYHVFNVYELARHIEIHKLTKYKKLLDDSIDVITRMTVPATLDPANKGEMVAGYHV